MQTERRVAANPQTKPTDLGCESADRLLSSADPMTLNDLERCNSPYIAFSPNSIALLADYLTVVENRPIISVKYCLSVPVFHFRPKLMYPAAWSLCDS